MCILSLIANTLFLMVSFFMHTSFCSKALRDVYIKEGDPIPTVPMGTTPYVVYRKSLPWLEARRICETTIGRLGVFYNEDDGYDVLDAIEAISIPFSETYDRKNNTEEFGMDRRYWFGLSDIGLEGDWTWMDDGRQLTYNSLWHIGQPDHIIKHKLEHCVSLWNPNYYLRENHSWNDEPCEHKLYFICEDLSKPHNRNNRKIIPATTSTTEVATPTTADATTKKPAATPTTATQVSTTTPVTTPTTTPLTTTKHTIPTPTTTTPKATTTKTTTTITTTTAASAIVAPQNSGGDSGKGGGAMYATASPCEGRVCTHGDQNDFNIMTQLGRRRRRRQIIIQALNLYY